MNFLSLCCHPADVTPAGLVVSAATAWEASGGLCFTFRIACPHGRLHLPPPAAAVHTDGLWQTTCCEAFVAAVDAVDYREFNFSPSGAWAAYRFTDYRQRDADWWPAVAPALQCACEEDAFHLTARVPAALLPSTRKFVLGLTTVIETREGEKTYWALSHAAAQPDFHHRESFTLELNRP